MTNTKFRKRALLSSVAMLLVALVALGSATFAWFTSDPNADAKGLSVQATTSTGLVVKTESDTEYSHHAKINNQGSTVNLIPATWKEDTGAFFTIAAAKDDEAGADPTKNFEAATVDRTSTTAKVYKEVVTLKVTGGADATAYLTQIKINSNSKAMSNAVTVLLTKADNTKVAEVNFDGNQVGRFDKTKIGDAVAYSTVGDSTATAVDGASAAALNKNLGTISSLDAGTAFNLYVYLDGEDSSVKTTAAIADELVSSIELYFTTDAPTP